MTQKNGAHIKDGVTIITLILLISCTGPVPTTISAFNGAGKITRVDTVRDEIYLDTSDNKRKAADVYVMKALSKIDTLPRRGDSMLYSVDAKTLKIDTFKIKKK